MMIFEEAWQSLFEKLPVHERLEIVSSPKGDRAARHAKEALLLSEGKEQVEESQRNKEPEGRNRKQSTDRNSTHRPQPSPSEAMESPTPSQSEGITQSELLWTRIIAELERQATRCETIAKDKSQEALTDESSEHKKNEQESKEWLTKSTVWREAEKIVRGFIEEPAVEPLRDR